MKCIKDAKIRLHVSDAERGAPVGATSIADVAVVKKKNHRSPSPG